MTTARRFLFPLLLCVASFGLLFFVLRPPSGPVRRTLSVAEEQLKLAAAAMEAGDWVAAGEAAKFALAEDPRLVPAMLVAAQSAAMANAPATALEYLSRLPSARDPDTISGRTLAIRLAATTGRFSTVCHHCREILNADPTHVEAANQLSLVLTMTGRWIEARDILMPVLQRHPVSLDQMLWLAAPTSSLDQAHFQRLLEWKQDPSNDDPLIDVAIGYWHLQREEWDEAVDVLSGDPQSSLIQSSLLAAALVGQGCDQLPENLASELPAVEADSEFFHAAMAQLAEQNSQPQQAMFSLLQAAKLNPLERSYCWKISRLARDLGKSDMAKLFERRAAVLDQERLLRVQILGNTPNGDALQKMSAVMLQQGRVMEGRSYLEMARQLQASSEAVESLNQRLEQLLALADVQLKEIQNPATAVDLNGWHSWGDQQEALAPEAEATPIKESLLALTDVSAEVQLSFTFQNGAEDGFQALRMHQFTGGGVAVVDFDNDSWPDLFFPQGDVGPDSAPSADGLFRNIRGKQFALCTLLSGVQHSGYGQGVSCEDLNADGFEDLYVARLGANALWQNNGDGTFSRIPLPDTQNEQWTTSCAISDLTGDGLPDIYDVNYLAGDDVTTRVCLDGEGIPRSCKPTLFPAAFDRVLKNLGNGRFQDVSQQLGIRSAAGRGLGIAVFREPQSQSPAILIANDGEANFLWKFNQQEGRFQESALQSGVAFNHRGDAEACMGIAIGDVDRNNLPDILLTNFYQETNTLYQYRDAGFFQDTTPGTALAKTSRAELGFGAQFVDLNLDGYPELFVANGHEGDYSDKGIPFRMQPRLFRNINGTFRPEAISNVYFDSKQLGRAVAVVDWNRDGRPDIVVTHLDTPVALLENQTDPVRQPVCVRLIAPNVRAVGIGTALYVQDGSDVAHQHSVFGGSGYLADNSSQIFTEDREGRNFSVRWADGSVQPEDIGDKPSAVREIVVLKHRGWYELPR